MVKITLHEDRDERRPYSVVLLAYVTNSSLVHLARVHKLHSSERHWLHTERTARRHAHLSLRRGPSTTHSREIQ